MNINIKTSHVELTDAIRSYVETKVAALGKYMDLSNNRVFLYVELEKTRPDQHNGDDLYRAEVTVDNAGEVYFTDAAAADLYAAIDAMQDEITRKVRRSQGKKQDTWRRGMAKIKKMLRFGN